MPFAIDGAAGASAMACSTALDTVTVVVPSMPPTAAVTTAEPAPSADASPFVPAAFETSTTAGVALDQVASEVGATSAQVALAWVHAKGRDVVPIPGTKRRTYLEQNVAALEVRLSDEQVARLDGVGAARGDRYADMSRVNL